MGTHFATCLYTLGIVLLLRAENTTSNGESFAQHLYLVPYKMILLHNSDYVLGGVIKTWRRRWSSKCENGVFSGNAE